MTIPKKLSERKVQQMKEEADRAHRDVEGLLNQIDGDGPGVGRQVAPVAAAAGGSLLGGLGSSFALSSWGSVAGLSASGISSGLAAAGALVGGGMAAGVSVLAVPVVVLGVGGYAIASAMKTRDAQPVEKLQHAIQELKTIEARLKPRRYFRSEIAQIEDDIKGLEYQKSKLT